MPAIAGRHQPASRRGAFAYRARYWRGRRNNFDRVIMTPLRKNATTTVVGGVNVQVLDPEAILASPVDARMEQPSLELWLAPSLRVAWPLRRVRVDPERPVRLASRWGGRDDLCRELRAVEHALGVLPRITDAGAEIVTGPRHVPVGLRVSPAT